MLERKRKEKGTEEKPHPSMIWGDRLYGEGLFQSLISFLPPFPGCQLKQGFLKISREIPFIWLIELDQRPKDNHQMY